MTASEYEARLVGGLEEEGFCGQRTVGKGLLLAVGPCLHVIMHAAEQHVDLEPRLAEMLEQALGKRPVQPIAVLSNLPSLAE
jgi:hypothetical protein